MAPSQREGSVLSLNFGSGHAGPVSTALENSVEISAGIKRGILLTRAEKSKYSCGIVEKKDVKDVCWTSGTAGSGSTGNNVNQPSVPRLQLRSENITVCNVSNATRT